MSTTREATGEPRPQREMTATELVAAFEREAGEPWFRTMVTHVSPPHPGIVPTWPSLIRERAMAEAWQAALREAKKALVDLDNEHLHDENTRLGPTGDCDVCDFSDRALARVAHLRQGEPT